MSRLFTDEYLDVQVQRIDDVGPETVRAILVNPDNGQVIACGYSTDLGGALISLGGECQAKGYHL